MQRYQKSISKLACCKQIYECLMVTSAINAASFTVSHIMPQFKLLTTYIHTVTHNAQLPMFDHPILKKVEHAEK